MTHQRLRTEKNCLNCSQPVEERFCTHCGQENLELQDNAFHLILHYFQDLFHYDGRLWHTLKTLVSKPGQVAKEYMEGKRKQNLEPIRFYVFASTVFFLLFFIHVDSGELNKEAEASSDDSSGLNHLQQEGKYPETSPDTIYADLPADSLQQKMDSSANRSSDSLKPKEEIEWFNSPLDTTLAKGWFGKRLQKGLDARQKEMQFKYGGDEIKAIRAFLGEVIHRLPQLFFISLPFFALFLKMLYWRNHRKRYVEHFIFSIYHYAYVFIIMILYLLLDWIPGESVGAFFSNAKSLVITALIIYPFIYLWLAMKRFYEDRGGSLVIRYFFLSFLVSLTILVLFIAIAIFTFIW